MSLMLWCSLLLGYGFGIGGAMLFLPAPIIEPVLGRFVVVSGILLGGAAALFLLRRERGLGPAVDPDAAKDLVAEPETAREAAPAAAADRVDEQAFDLVRDARDLELLGRLTRDPLARAVDGSLQPRELRQILFDGRVDCLARPALALPEAEEAFLHVVARLRDASGVRLEPCQYMHTAARCGLIALLERVAVIRALRSLLVYSQADRVPAVCCGITPSSLTSPVLVDGLTEFLDDHEELEGKLILALDRMPSEAASKAAMAELASQGVRFCLRRLSAAPVDLERARGLGFSFIHLAAPGFALLPAVGHALPQLAALQAAIAQAGLQLVVDQAEARRVPLAADDLPLDPPDRGLGDDLQEDAA